MKLILGSVVALALVAGCKSSDPNSNVTASRKEGASNAKSGWKEVTTSGVSISFPPEWVAMDLTKGQFDEAMNKAAQSDPNSHQMMEMAKKLAASGMVKLLVFDPNNTGNGFARNVNLVVAPAMTKSIEEEVKLNTQQFQMMAPKAKITGTVVDLPIGKTGLLESVLPGQGGDRVTLGYMLLRGKDTYVITFTDLASRSADLKPKAEEIMQTVKVP